MVEVLLENQSLETVVEDCLHGCNAYEAARTCASAIGAVQSIHEGRPVRIPKIVDRNDAIKRFGPLPTALLDSNKL